MNKGRSSRVGGRAALSAEAGVTVEDSIEGQREGGREMEEEGQPARPAPRAEVTQTA